MTACVMDSAWDYRLQIKNASQRAITLRYCDDSIPLSKEFENISVYDISEIKPSDTKSIWNKRQWDKELTYSYNKKLNLYFFDIDTLKKYSDMDKIVKNKLWIKQMSVSKEELEKNNWVVVFKE